MLDVLYDRCDDSRFIVLPVNDAHNIVHIIVTDLKRQEMDDITVYFQMICRHSFGRTCKPSMERRIRQERECFLLNAYE